MLRCGRTGGLVWWDGDGELRGGVREGTGVGAVVASDARSGTRMHLAHVGWGSFE